MALSAKELNGLRRIVALAQRLIDENPEPRRGRPIGSTQAERESSKPKRVRRSGRELEAFRTLIISEHKKGVSVAKLAEAHAVSAAYIYGLIRAHEGFEWIRKHPQKT